MIQTLSDALAQQGYDTLTPVQQAVTDPDLLGSDLLVSAQTGSGKTVGFGLAIAPTLLGDATMFPPAASPLALIIAPTRELAMQVTRELSWLYAKAGAVVTSCVGGMDSRAERRALERGAHVVVATPGRLCDHIKRGNIDMTALRAVVLDEADEMLDLGFREELEFILSEAPESRRTLLFSATVPAAIAKLAQSYQKDAKRISTAGEAKQHSDIEYRALNTHPRDTENAIINVLRYYEAKNAIVFCNTRAAVARLTTRFTNRGFSVVALSGELTQSERSNALQSLRDGRARVCVATDVAARGIDLPNLELVIHADLPSNSDTLLHRSGRTGRAGRKGVSALIVPPKMRGKANRLIGWAKLKVEWADPPSAAEVMAQDQERLLADPAWSTPLPDDAQSFADTLLATFSPEQLAAGFVSLYNARQSAPEELSDPASSDDSRPRPAFGPSVWFSVSLGRNDDAEPRVLLPMLCRMGDLTKDDIGAIRVQPSHSFIEVLASRADHFLAAIGPDMALEGGAKLTRLDKAPNLDRDNKGKPGRGPKPTGPRGPRPTNTDRPQGKRFDPLRERPAPAAGKSDAPRAETPRGEATAKPYKPAAAPKGHKPAAAPKGHKPPKSHKTERSAMKPGAAPKPKAERAKPVWTKDNRAATTGTDRPAKGGAKPAAHAKPNERPNADAAKRRAADPSKRFEPPHKRGKTGGKPAPKKAPKR